MPMPFTHPKHEPEIHGPPWFVNGKWVYTRNGKPRQPGALRHLPEVPDDFNEWPPDIQAEFDKMYDEPWDDPKFAPLP